MNDGNNNAGKNRSGNSRPADVTPGNELLFCALGGSGEIGMNVNLYGTQGKWLMVDLGMTFSGGEYPGVDLVFADLDFIEDRRRDLVGVVLTHAHEDHIGAVPYFAQELGVPLYATPFTARLVAAKLAEAGLTKKVDLRVIDHLDRFDLGPFGVTYLPMAHSIAEGHALLIDTSFGRVFHTGDWKLDANPVIGHPASPAELTAIGDGGVLAMVCDSTNVFNAEASGSEGEVARALTAEVARHKGKRVVVTSFASNVARLQSLGEAARADGRRLVVAGRSLDRIIEAARASGYLKDLPELVPLERAHGPAPRPGSDRRHRRTGRAARRAGADRGRQPPGQARPRATPCCSPARQIPGNEIAIGRIQNVLAGRGIDIVTDRQTPIHVSGHPGRPELEALYGWVRPQTLIPVHGEMRHMREQARVARAAGVPQTVVQKNGDVVRIAPGKPGVFAQVRAGRLVLDGDIIAPADGETIAVRRRLAANGLVIVAVSANGSAQVAALGLPLIEDYDAFVAEAEADIAAALVKLKAARTRDRDAVIEAARLAVRRAAARWSGKKPQVQVMLIGDTIR